MEAMGASATLYPYYGNKCATRLSEGVSLPISAFTGYGGDAYYSSVSLVAHGQAGRCLQCSPVMRVRHGRHLVMGIIHVPCASLQLLYYRYSAFPPVLLCWAGSVCMMLLSGYRT